MASGIDAGLKALGKKKDTKIIVIAGDGATMDIGFGAISGAFERGHDFTYVCMDNEAYMNTGVQRSSGTPYDASTTTTPAGKFSFGNPFPKKNMPAIIAAHDRKSSCSGCKEGVDYYQVHIRIICIEGASSVESQPSESQDKSSQEGNSQVVAWNRYGFSVFKSPYSCAHKNHTRKGRISSY